MEIRELKYDATVDGNIRISAMMDDFQLWYELPAIEKLPETAADSFAIMGLAPSMLQGRRLRIAPEFPVSETLLTNFETIQKIFHCWNPAFQMIPIEATSACAGAPRDSVGSMFSGGVDSLHTLMCHGDEISEAILVGGFDMGVDSKQFSISRARNEALCRHVGVHLTDVRTNQISWSSRTRVRRAFWHSAYLASAALFFQNRKILIPSSHTYAWLNPLGSHMILDHLWSNGCTSFVYSDPDTSRSSKTRMISSDDFILKNLRVCWANQNENCGECPKCLRTMLTLELIGKPGPFPRNIKSRDVKAFTIKDWEDVDYLMDNLVLAKEVGRWDMVRALRAAFRRYERRESVIAFDSGFLGGSLRRFRNRIRGGAHWTGQVSRHSDMDV